jgi:hypothetical protein
MSVAQNSDSDSSSSDEDTERPLKGRFKDASEGLKWAVVADYNLSRKLEPGINPVTRSYKFIDLRYHLHADEKWFYMVRTQKKVKLLGGYIPVQETTRHKKHIEKVMFIAVVGMPHRLADGTWWDGKVGMFPLIEHGQAIRNSEYRPAGADVINCLSVTAAVYRDFMLKPGGVFDTIKEKCHLPREPPSCYSTMEHPGTTSVET